MAAPQNASSDSVTLPQPKAQPEPPKQAVKAQPATIKSAEAARGYHVCYADAKHTAAEVKHPGYLWRSASRFRPYDDVLIIHDGGEYYIRLLLLAVDDECQGITARVIEDVELVKCELIVPNMAEAFVAEAGDMWAVRAGQSVLKSGFKTKEQAGRWLLDKAESLKEGR